MADSSTIREDMEVIGADGGHVGTVDKIEGARMKLTRKDRGAGDRHHYIDVAHVADVEGDKVRLAFNSDLATQFWETE